METIETEVFERQIHKFSCDGCGNDLGSSVECDDGYYEQLGEYEQKFYILNNGRYAIKANYCKKCAEKKTQEIVSALEALGFYKETN